MRAIALYGSEEQKQKYLPSLADFKTIACWATTEPGHGSNVKILSTTARKVEGGWILDGQKRWIGNSTFADVLIVCANNTGTNMTNVFIVKKGAPGLQVSKTENKIGLRIVQNGDIILKNVFVPDEDRLPGINSGFNESIGISMGAYDLCHRYLFTTWDTHNIILTLKLRYLKERNQFGAPLAAFQLNQQKLVRMLSNIQAMFLVGWCLCKLCESGKMTSGHASLTKSWTTMKARETVALARELLGGNGVVADFLVAKAFCDLEPVYTYEGTYDINTLIVGKEVLGIPSFGPPSSTKRSRL